MIPDPSFNTALSAAKAEVRGTSLNEHSWPDLYRALSEEGSPALPLLDLLLPQVATTDFLWTWRTHESGEVTRNYLWDTQRHEFKLPPEGWWVLEEWLIGLAMVCASTPTPEHHGRSDLLYAVKTVDECRSILQRLERRYIHPEGSTYGTALLGADFVHRVLLDRVNNCRVPMRGDGDRLLLKNIQNTLRMQLPSGHPGYTLPSDLLRDEARVVSQLLEDRARRDTA